jgi:CheY-like chemotaxis protein
VISPPSAPLVLVVDDDPDILDSVCEILADEGYRVARARNGAEGLERLAAEQPGMVLLDLMMPVMDGATFARILREREEGPRLPVVLLSADGRRERALEVGADAFLPKPFDIDALLEQVARWTGGAGAGKRARPPQA